MALVILVCGGGLPPSLDQCADLPDAAPMHVSFGFDERDSLKPLNFLLYVVGSERGEGEEGRGSVESLFQEYLARRINFTLFRVQGC